MTRAFAAAAADMILEHGPLALPDLHARARALGLTRSAHPESLRASLRAGAYVLRPDGRYDAAARLLRGQVFTARPRTASPRNVLWTRRDLEPLDALTSLPLRGGGDVRRGAGAVECWTGPDGWLPELGPGQLLGLRWDGAALEVVALDDVPGLDSATARDAREVLSRHARAGRADPLWPDRFEEPTALCSAVVSALVEAPDLFAAPLPPLREMLPLPAGPQLLEATPDHSPGSHQTVTVALPHGTHAQLTRTAQLLGERLPDYLAALLTASAGRDLGHEPVTLAGPYVDLDLLPLQWRG